MSAATSSISDLDFYNVFSTLKLTCELSNKSIEVKQNAIQILFSYLTMTKDYWMNSVLENPMKDLIHDYLLILSPADRNKYSALSPSKPQSE